MKHIPFSKKPCCQKTVVHLRSQASKRLDSTAFPSLCRSPHVPSVHSQQISNPRRARARSSSPPPQQPPIPPDPPRPQPLGRTNMKAMEELSELSESMRQAASLLSDDDPSEESAPRRPTTFLNAVALGNVVSIRRCSRPLAICC
jgi:hypothetical protein